MRCEPPKSAGLGRTGTGTSACDHTYPACYAARRTCCSNAALGGGMFSIVREPCANTAFHTPLAEHVLLYTTTRNLSIPSRVSERSRLQAAEIDGGRHILRMDKICKRTMVTFSVAEAARHSVAPTGSIEEHLCFFIDIFNNLLDSNLSNVSTDAKSNPEFIKPKRRQMPYYKDNHICVHGSDYQFAESLSCTMRNVEQNARICLLVGTWLEILDITHVILCGDDRFILCADDHLSASFACM